MLTAEIVQTHIGQWPLEARLLAKLSRDPKAPDYSGGTEVHVGEKALDFILDTVPGFLDRIRGKRVLDFGCGMGDQALAMKRAGALSVVAYDPFPKMRESIPGVEFTATLPSETFDVVLSSSSFEHFAHPEREMATMRSLTKPTGELIITWAEPWFSHNGSHMCFFSRVPWVNLLFSERAIMQMRSLYRKDGATKYSECGLGGALNRMTVGRFETIVRESGMAVKFQRHFTTRNLPAVSRVPVLRELLTSACAVILTQALD